MSHFIRATELLRNTASALGELAAQAAKAGAYTETSQIAELASRIADLADANTANQPGASQPHRKVPAASVSTHQPSPQRARHTAKPKNANEKTRYPRFERRGEELVKIGYSTSEGGEYEHRAPKPAIDEVVREFERRASTSDLVATTQLLPVISRRDGSEVPSYQVYVTLAWLRESGLIEAIGRQGYRLCQTRPLRHAVDQLWSEVAAR